MTTVANLRKLIAASGKARPEKEIDFLTLYCYGYALSLYNKKLIDAEIEISGGRVVFGEDYCKSSDDLPAADLYMLEKIIIRHSHWHEEDFISELREWGFREGEKLTDEKIRELFYHGLTDPGTDEEEKQLIDSVKVEVPIEIIRSVVRGEKQI